MEKLITDMMFLENITEKELYRKKEIKTSFGETLSWDYLTFARKILLNGIFQHISYMERKIN